MQVESTSKPMLTVGEAKENTISALEETDAAVDLRIKNSVCLVIDLEGFFVRKIFQVRELGYYSWNEHFGRHAFFQPAALKGLSHKDKKTVNFAKHNIHGLTYQPRYQERAYEHDEVDIVLLRLYSQFKTEKRTVVAYKGGHVEKDLIVRQIEHSLSRFRNLGLSQIRTVKTNDCRTVSELWFSLK